MRSARSNQRAFTLLELMLVVAIMGIAMALAYPVLADLIHRPPMTAAVKELTELCKSAREQAILKDAPVELRIYPGDGHMEVADVPPDQGLQDSSGSSGGATQNNGSNPDSKPRMSYIVSSYVKTGQLDISQLRIDMLDVNFVELNQADVARVRFYPNGTCDEFTMVLSSAGETRKLTLQVVTALLEAQTL